MLLPMMDTIAAPMMNGALALYLLEKYTVVHIEKLASTFGGTVILGVGLHQHWIELRDQRHLQLSLPCLKPESRYDCRLEQTVRHYS